MNIKNNQVNDIHNKELKFDSNYSTVRKIGSNQQSVVVISLITGKKVNGTHASVFTYLWEIIYYDSITKINK